MRLFEHPDFEQAILQAAEHFRERKLRPAIIEKDYYVTEALRVIAATSGDKIIFKGGTSLAKGWNLIQRFSEDIDIFLDPIAFQPTLGKNAIDRELKKLRDAVGQHPALSFVEAESHTIERIRSKRSLLLYPAIRRARRGRQPRVSRSGYSQRPRTIRHGGIAFIFRPIPGEMSFACRSEESGVGAKERSPATGRPLHVPLILFDCRVD